MASPVVMLAALVVIVLCVVAAAVIFKGKKGTGVAPALDAAKYQQFTLKQKTRITHNTLIFRFGLPNPSQRLGLPVGKHMFLRFEEDGKPISRPYTPITSDHELGYFDLLIKVYPQGKMTQFLDKMEVGQTIDVRGPIGSCEYKGKGEFVIQRPGGAINSKIKHIGMIAGGTGITPMLQIIREIIRQPTADQTKVTLIFANVSEADILLRQEMTEIVEKHSNIKVFYTLDNPPEGWTQGKGYVTAQMINEQMPAPSADVMMLLCGPKPMVDGGEKNLLAIGHAENAIFKY